MSVTSIEETSGSPLSGYTGESVDYSSLTFEATYEDSSTGSVTPASCSPSVWGEAGTQTITFSFTGTDVTCEVEGTALAVITLDSLSISGSLTNTQFVGHSPDVSGLTVTAHYSDSTLDKTVIATVTPSEYTTTGEQNITFSYSDEYGSATEDYSVTVSAVVLTSLVPSGSMDEDNQLTGSAPDITGMTFKAEYNDGSEATIDPSNIVVTPAVYDANGNPNNLGQQTVTFSYTEGGVTDSDSTLMTVHRPASGQILNMNQEGWIYFDMPAEVKTIFANGQWGPAALFQSQGASIGDPAFFVFDESTYENDTPVTAATLGSWLPLYGLGSQGETFAEVGTPNTSGFKPAYGVRVHPDLDDSYVSIRTDGTATMSAGDETVYVVVGLLASNLDGTSYKLSDMDAQNSITYSAICRKS